MKLADRVVVVTGAGGGIGAALARRFAAEGARAIEVVDRDGAAAERVSAQIGDRATAAVVDVADEAAVRAHVDDVLARHGRIDLFFSNAGLGSGTGIEGGAAADRAWQQAWSVHVLAHLYAARAVLPSMVDAGEGYLLNTASAAGLLGAPGDAPYTVTKHAAVALAEWLSYSYRHLGVRVSVLCPMGVDTPLLMGGLGVGSPAARAVAASGEILTPEAVADAVVAGVSNESFLILPHPEVGKFFAGKAADMDRWLAGMSELAVGTGAAGLRSPHDQ